MAAIQDGSGGIGVTYIISGARVEYEAYCIVFGH